MEERKNAERFRAGALPSSNVMAEWLERLYQTYNRPAYIAPDPLEAVYWYTCPEDQEIAGLIGASLAYGRASQIVLNTRTVLAPMDPSPRAFIEGASGQRLRSVYNTFRHRWSTAEELISVLSGIRGVLRQYGSLEACYRSFHDGLPDTPRAGLTGLTKALGGPNSILADPAKPSACKRWHLYLRWMVRRDGVDPGCWRSVDPAGLIIPLDTHMHRTALMLGFTTRRQADLKAALEITDAFRQICPGDPLRYDFVLTRFGIHPGLDAEGLRESMAKMAAAG